MGEIADMMLDGFMDEETGEIIDGDSPGFPRRMSDPNCYFAEGVIRTPEQQEKQRAKNRAKRARRKAQKIAQVSP